VVSCVVEWFDDLNKPIERLNEVHRVLRPGDKVIIPLCLCFSMDDQEYWELSKGFQLAGGCREWRTVDITASVPSDYNGPMLIIEAVKD
jgi:hypothetical protein